MPLLQILKALRCPNKARRVSPRCHFWLAGSLVLSHVDEGNLCSTTLTACQQLAMQCLFEGLGGAGDGRGNFLLDFTVHCAEVC